MAFDISKFAQELGGVSETDMLDFVDIGKIATNSLNFYPRISEAEADALRESIEANGLLEPLTVMHLGLGQYRLISGHNRLRALRQLVGTDRNSKWVKVPCRILPPMTKAQELCAIIEANRQRKKNGALLAEEARILTEQYLERKKAGEELPGKIRARVAEALQVHETKLAVLSAIEKNLTLPGLREEWKLGRISETVAYELSKLDKKAQGQMWDRYCDGARFTAKDVKDFGTAWSVCFHECAYTGGFCPHAEKIVNSFAKDGNLSGCAGCCNICKSQGYCGSKCQYIPEPESVTKFKAEREAQRAKETAEREERNRLYNQKGHEAWKRLAQAAQDREKSYKDVLEALGWEDPDNRDAQEMEKRATGQIIGKGDGTALFVHPFEECAVDQIDAVADLLGVSVDWIMGRPTPVYGFDLAEPEGQLALFGWMPGGTNPVNPCDVVAKFDLGNKKLHAMLCRWDGNAFVFKQGGEKVSMEPIKWIMLPEDE